ncbi:MAG: hypothetical protein BWY70_01286 [Bacteroidetes bacterium ADurb.Bin408]|nr:MAG: hypothetical protein BWY70_01286 [Bacteroidetes bacterium ADurb.Bin408]
MDKDILNWLLEPENPSVRYFTLTKLLCKSEDEADVAEAKHKIMTTGIVPNNLRLFYRKGRNVSCRYTMFNSELRTLSTSNFTLQTPNFKYFKL